MDRRKQVNPAAGKWRWRGTAGPPERAANDRSWHIMVFAAMHKISSLLKSLRTSPLALGPSISGRRSPIVADVGTGLTAALTLATLGIVSRPDGRSGKDRKVAGEESPGSMDMRCRLMAGGRKPRESATETRPPWPAPDPPPLAGEEVERQR